MSRLAVLFGLIFSFSSYLFAEENVVAEKPREAFIGIDFFSGESELEQDFSGAVSGTSKTDFDQSGFRLKFGREVDNGLRFQAYFFSEDFEGDAFEDAFDNSIFGFGADLIKAFDTSSSFSPYISGGISLELVSLDDSAGIDYVDDFLRAFGLKIGTGVLYRVSNSIELVAGIDLKYRTWQEIKFVGGSGTVDLEMSDQGTQFFGAIHYRY